MLRRGLRSPVLWVAVLAVAAKLPFLALPPSPDEGGFLMVGAQWRPGTDLYGDYWVDRPPLLIGLMWVADRLGRLSVDGHALGVAGLRLIGCVAAAAAVLLAGAIGRRIGPKVGRARAATYSAIAAGALASTPLLGASEVPGELLALPWVLAGILACLLAADEPSRRALWLSLAGGAAAAAFLTKQNFVDVAVFAMAFLLAGGVGPRRAAQLLRSIGWLMLGGVLVLGAFVGLSAVLGTSPAGLWEAVVTFRLRANHLIADSSSGAPLARLSRLPMTLLESGEVALLLMTPLLVAAGWRRGRQPQPVAIATLVLLAWEVLAVLSGGNYWTHYLLQLVPALALGVAMVPSESWLRNVTVAALGWGALSCAVSVVVVALRPEPLSSQVAGEWLAEHHAASDTAIVAYGQPNLLRQAGVASPYPELWSLPVRVRDPDLRRLQAVVEGPDAPEWLFVWEGRLQSWELDSAALEKAVATRYRPVAQVCDYQVLLRDDVRRDVSGTPIDCP